MVSETVKNIVKQNLWEKPIFFFIIQKAFKIGKDSTLLPYENIRLLRSVLSKTLGNYYDFPVGPLEMPTHPYTSLTHHNLKMKNNPLSARMYSFYSRSTIIWATPAVTMHSCSRVHMSCASWSFLVLSAVLPQPGLHGRRCGGKGCLCQIWVFRGFNLVFSLAFLFSFSQLSI